MFQLLGFWCRPLRALNSQPLTTDMAPRYRPLIYGVFIIRRLGVFSTRGKGLNSRKSRIIVVTRCRCSTGFLPFLLASSLANRTLAAFAEPRARHTSPSKLANEKSCWVSAYHMGDALRSITSAPTRQLLGSRRGRFS